MKKSINAVKLNCNSCENKTCSAYVEPCRGFKSYKQATFSFLEMAIGKSATSVNDLLAVAGLEFMPNNTDRGFDLAKM